MEKVRLGMIGCGVIGTIHLQMAVKSPDLEIVAVADLIEERAKKAAEDFGVGTYYLSGDEMLDDDRI